MNAPNTRTLLLALAAAIAAPAAVTQEPADHSTLRFPGGSLTEFADALRTDAARRGEAINIVLPDTADSVPVPAIELTDASVGDALDAVGAILTTAVRIDVGRFESDAGHRAVYAVRILPVRGEEAPPSPRIVRVLSLAVLTPNDTLPDLYALPAETVLTAIETGLSIQGKSDAVLRYHEDSKLLFVQGSGDEVAMAEQVLRQLERDVREIRNLVPRTRPAVARPPEDTGREETPEDPVADPPPVRRRR